MIALEEAQQFVRESLSALPPIEVALDAALGCVAADDVIAHVPVPGFANSAMDGYALRAVDTNLAPTRLRVVGSMMAGDATTIGIHENQAMRIMTGAPLPHGTDCVCMIEEVVVESDGQHVVIPRALKTDDHVRHPGEDVSVGQVLIAKGDEVRAARIGVLATQGTTSLWVYPRPRVGVLSTGNELVHDAGPLAPGKIHDSNRPMLLALLRQSGFIPIDLGSSDDNGEHIADKFRAAVQSCDAVVSTGGVSVGDADHVKTVIKDLCSANARWMQVAIKPGKPFTFGTTPGHTPIFGLAGNPVSTLVGFEMFVRPALRLLAGHPKPNLARVPAVLDCPIPRRLDGKVHLVHAMASFRDDGRLHVEQLARQGSHLLNAVARANVLLVVPDGEDIAIGDEVSAIFLGAPR